MVMGVLRNAAADCMIACTRVQAMEWFPIVFYSVLAVASVIALIAACVVFHDSVARKRPSRW